VGNEHRAVGVIEGKAEVERNPSASANEVKRKPPKENCPKGAT